MFVTLRIEKGNSEVNNMKGYAVAEGYMGFVEDGYMLFASETDYEEYMN